jgi:hypothetical protein
MSKWRVGEVQSVQDGGEREGAKVAWRELLLKELGAAFGGLCVASVLIVLSVLQQLETRRDC